MLKICQIPERQKVGMGGQLTLNLKPVTQKTRLFRCSEDSDYDRGGTLTGVSPKCFIQDAQLSSTLGLKDLFSL